MQVPNIEINQQNINVLPTLSQGEKLLELIKIVGLIALGAIIATIAAAAAAAGATFYCIVIIEILAAPTPMTPLAILLCINGIVGSIICPLYLGGKPACYLFGLAGKKIQNYCA